MICSSHCTLWDMYLGSCQGHIDIISICICPSRLYNCSLATIVGGCLWLRQVVSFSISLKQVIRPKTTLTLHSVIASISPYMSTVLTSGHSTFSVSCIVSLSIFSCSELLRSRPSSLRRSAFASLNASLPLLNS